MRDKPLPCFTCGKPLEPAVQGQPAGATTFSSYGQYGSTAFDPQDNSQIQINICDTCLLDNKDRVWHVRYRRQQAQEIFSKPWDPEAWT